MWLLATDAQLGTAAVPASTCRAPACRLRRWSEFLAGVTGVRQASWDGATNSATVVLCDADGGASGSARQQDAQGAGAAQRLVQVVGTDWHGTKQEALST